MTEKEKYQDWQEFLLDDQPLLEFADKDKLKLMKENDDLTRYLKSLLEQDKDALWYLVKKDVMDIVAIADYKERHDESLRLAELEE